MFSKRSHNSCHGAQTCPLARAFIPLHCRLPPLQIRNNLPAFLQSMQEAHLHDECQALASPFRQACSARTTQQRPPYHGASVPTEHFSFISMRHTSKHPKVTPWHHHSEHPLHIQHIHSEKRIRVPPPSVLAATSSHGAWKQHERNESREWGFAGPITEYLKLEGTHKDHRVWLSVHSTLTQPKMKIPQLNRNNSASLSQTHPL